RHRRHPPRRPFPLTIRNPCRLPHQTWSLPRHLQGHRFHPTNTSNQYPFIRTNHRNSTHYHQPHPSKRPNRGSLRRYLHHHRRPAPVHLLTDHRHPPYWPHPQPDRRPHWHPDLRRILPLHYPGVGLQPNPIRREPNLHHRHQPATHHHQPFLAPTSYPQFALHPQGHRQRRPPPLHLV